MKNSTQKELLIKLRTDVLVSHIIMAEILSEIKGTTYEKEYDSINELATRTEIKVRQAVTDWDIQFAAEAN